MAGREFTMIEHNGVLYRPEDFEALGLGKASPDAPVGEVQKESKPAAAKTPAKKAPAKKATAKKAVSTKVAKPSNKAATPDGDKGDA